MLAASAEVQCALVELRVATRDLHDPQRALSALVRLTPERLSSVLASKRDAAVEIKAHGVDLAARTHVEVLRDVAREFAGEEEVQHALCGVVATASRLSRRLQTQAGCLELWRELSHVRALHPMSRRVLLGSLAATTAILRGGDWNTMTLLLSPSSLSVPGPTVSAAELLVEELLQLLHRFGHRCSTTTDRAAGQREPDAEVGVASMRLLAVLLSGPSTVGSGGDPLSGLMKRFSTSIAAAMLSNLTMFQDASDGNDEDDPMLTWLVTCRELTRLLPLADVQSLLFQPSLSLASDKTSSSWYERILVDCWQHEARHQDGRYRRVLLVYLSILTRLFALPHSRDDEVCSSILATMLTDRPRVVAALCGLVGTYHQRSTSNNNSSSQHEDAVTLLELLRLIRQWCERPSGAKLMANNISVSESLASVLAAIIDSLVAQRNTREDASPSGSALDRATTAQTQLEALLIAQKLALRVDGGLQVVRSSLHQALAPSPSEQHRGMPQRNPASHRSRRQSVSNPSRDITSPTSPASTSTVVKALGIQSDECDDDLSMRAVLARELASTIALFTSAAGPVSKSSLAKPRSNLPSSLRAHFQPKKRSSERHHHLKTSTVAIYTSHT